MFLVLNIFHKQKAIEILQATNMPTDTLINKEHSLTLHTTLQHYYNSLVQWAVMTDMSM